MTRNYAIDNAKFLMILAVVFGHFIEPLINSSAVVKTVYMAIYSWHMPVLILLAGMLSSPDYSQQNMIKLENRILFPLLIFTFLYEVFHVVSYLSVSSYTINLQPYWLLWFLYSLLIWRLLLPLALRLPYPIAISVAVSLVAGYFDQIGYFLGISRTIYFFPFFLLGYRLTTSLFNNERLLKTPASLFVGVLLLNLGLFWLFSDYSHRWLYGSFSYGRLKFDDWDAALIRAGLYSLSVVSAIAILGLIPRRHLRITAAGANSLYAYVWHGFLVKLFWGAGLIYFFRAQPPAVALALLFTLSLVVTWALSSRTVARLTQGLLLEPFIRLVRIRSRKTPTSQSNQH